MNAQLIFDAADKGKAPMDQGESGDSKNIASARALARADMLNTRTSRVLQQAKQLLQLD